MIFPGTEVRLAALEFPHPPALLHFEDQHCICFFFPVNENLSKHDCFPAMMLAISSSTFRGIPQGSGTSAPPASQSRSYRGFTQGMAGHWDRLPGELVESPALEGFKRHVDVALSNMFSDGLASVRLLVGFDDLKGLF